MPPSAIGCSISNRSQIGVRIMIVLRAAPLAEMTAGDTTLFSPKRVIGRPVASGVTIPREEMRRDQYRARHRASSS